MHLLVYVPAQTSLNSSKRKKYSQIIPVYPHNKYTEKAKINLNDTFKDKLSF